MAEPLNTCFTGIVVTLNIPECKGLLTALENNENPISNIIEKYKNHPSIIAIKNAFPSHSFFFGTVNRDEILKKKKKRKSKISIRLRQRK